jgi:NAD(P) transhydrogenase subunit alpha
MPAHASELYARNVTELLELLVDGEGKLALDFTDEIVAGACVAGRPAQPEPDAAVSDKEGVV